MRTTPEHITKLEANQIFVFGSNVSGLHSGGAAKKALEFGAEIGIGVGLSGNTYAIPTVDLFSPFPFSLSTIDYFVKQFILFAKSTPKLTFLVTPIGCGIAGFKPKDIAPMFKEAMRVENIYLPKQFQDVLIDTTEEAL